MFSDSITLELTVGRHKRRSLTAIWCYDVSRNLDSAVDILFVAKSELLEASGESQVAYYESKKEGRRWSHWTAL